MKKKMMKRSIFNGISVLVIIFFVLSALLPFYWMTITSFKTTKELFSMDSPLTLKTPTFKHYHDLLSLTPFGNWFLNSLIVSIGSTFIALVFGTLAAYGISRIPSKSAIRITQMTLLTYLIPRVVFVIPLYSLLNALGILDSLTGLILAYTSFTLPFTIWLLLGFFQGIPQELDEAAMIDGCSRVKALIKIVLPLAISGVISAGIYSFSEAWNELMYPLALIQTQSKATLTVGISSLKQADIFAWGQIMAAGTLGSLPVLILYVFIYKRIVGGLLAGSVKG
jgi:multiple sugar transport system permease protein